MKTKFFLFIGFSVASLACLGQATAVGRNSGLAVKKAIYEVADIALLTAQVATVAENTRLLFERFNDMQRDLDEVKNLMKSDGIKNYMKLRPDDPITQDVRNASMKVAMCANLLILLQASVVNVGKDVTQSTIDNSLEYAGVITDAAEFTGKGTATLGISTVFDPTSVVTSLNLLKANFNTQNVKNLVLQFIVQLQNANNTLEDVFDAVDRVAYRVRLVNRIGLDAFPAPNPGNIYTRKRIMDKRIEKKNIDAQRSEVQRDIEKMYRELDRVTALNKH